MHFDEWFPSAKAFAQGALYYRQIARPKEAVFSYHQAAERAYHCALLVLGLYSPLCRARHKGDYAERRTMPMAINFGRSAERLGGFRAA